MKDSICKIKIVLDKTRYRKPGLLFIFMFLGGILELVGVAGVFPIIDAITGKDESGYNLIYILCMGLIGIYILKNLFLAYMYHRIYKYVFDGKRRLSAEIFRRMLDKPYEYHLSTNIAEIQRLIRGDSDGFFIATKAILQLASELIICIILAVMLFCVNFTMALMMGLLIGICVGLVLLISKKRIIKLGKEEMIYSTETIKWMMQGIGGVKEVKLLGKESFFEKKYERYDRMSSDRIRKQQFLTQIPRLFTETICIVGIMIWIMFNQWMGNDLVSMLPMISVFVVAAFRLLPSVGKINALLAEYNFYKPKIDSIYNEISSWESKTDERTVAGSIPFDEKIEVKDLSFKYKGGNDFVLNDVSLVISKGESVGIVGKSGAGKSTLVDLIMGLLESDRGKVCSDGHPVNDNLNSWYSMIGYVPQNIYLSDDSIRNNIAFGIDEEIIDDKKINDALVKAQLGEFITMLPNGLDTVVGDRGVRLSGGQRQRIAIARALYNDPELLILDEATSALDNETESAVMDAIEHLHGQVTMLIIAHRMSTIEKCDSVYKITDKGTVEKVR